MTVFTKLNVAGCRRELKGVRGVKRRVKRRSGRG